MTNTQAAEIIATGCAEAVRNLMRRKSSDRIITTGNKARRRKNRAARTARQRNRRG